jgi:DNA polymerase elongation subunit (family B)
LTAIYEGRVELDKFIVTKSLRSNYKNPAQIAHKVLADRIGVRDPGNRPRAGDRIRYVYIVNPKRSSGGKVLQGEKIETPEFMAATKMKLDYDHYVTNQIMKPLQQLLALDLENLAGFNAKSFHAKMTDLRKKWPDDAKYAKKVEELRTKEVKILVFDKFLSAK